MDTRKAPGIHASSARMNGIISQGRSLNMDQTQPPQTLTPRPTPGEWYVNLYGSNVGKIYIGPLGYTCGIAEVRGAVEGVEADLANAAHIVQLHNSYCETVSEAKRCVNAHDELVQALEAIVARYSGEWDNPALIKFGELQTCAPDDMVAIARQALALARATG